MTDAQKQLTRALFSREGVPRRITRIELEPLDATHCRWTLWGEAGRLYSAVAAPEDLGPMLASTRILLDCQMSGPPAAREAQPFPTK